MSYETDETPDDLEAREREAERVAECERQFLRRKPHELRMSPPAAVTAYALTPPIEVIEVVTGEKPVPEDGS